MNMLLYQILAYNIHGNIQKSYKKQKIEIWSPIRNDKFELPDGSYFVSGIPDYVKYIIKNHEAVSDNPPIIIYIKKGK